MAAVAALAGCVDREAQEQAKKTEELIKDPTTVVEVMTVSASNVSDTLSITGTIQTSDDVEVTAIVAGVLVAVNVKDGDVVSRGQAVARVDDSDYRALLEQARARARVAKSALDQAKADAEVGPLRSAARVGASEARLEQAKFALQKLINGARPEEIRQADAQVAKAESDRDTAKLALDRAISMEAEGAISKSELERAQNEYRSAVSAYDSAIEAQTLVNNASREEDISAAGQAVRAAEQQLLIDKADQRLDVMFGQKVDSAEANWHAAQRTFDLAQIALDNTTLRSPFAGRVSGRPKQAGTYVAPGTPIMRIVGTKGAYFEAELPESLITSLPIGVPVQVTVDALRGVTIGGTLVAVSPNATESGRLFLARVQLDQVPDGMRAGMFARGVVTLDNRSGVHLLPSEALLQDSKGAYVYLMAGDQAERLEVQPGATRNGSTEVTGLSDGDLVIIKGQTTIGDGSAVRIEASAPVAKEA
ncbi:MAG: efflux RND transporter periplasmic adaptor subunit [Armatimonadetes bacterium]|nr:efflux RND transporter periplasmic adaptor subunit [Armatimonadota bacterium]